MLNSRNWILVSVVLIIFTACNKGAGCFDRAGDIKTVLIDVPEFTSIDVTSNVDVELLSSGSNLVKVTTGENLISGISLNVEEGVLKIDNLNSCFWSKGYTRPLVIIRNVALEKIIQHGFGRVYNTDTLTIANLSLQVEDASGEVDLTLDAGFVRVVSNNIGPITLKGKTGILNAGHYWSDGILYAKDLKVQDCNITHFGSNRMELNIVNKLEGKMGSLGNVYLYGQAPTIETVNNTGDGRIIAKY